MQIASKPCNNTIPGEVDPGTTGPQGVPLFQGPLVLGLLGLAWACLGLLGLAWAFLGWFGLAWACLGLLGLAWA